MEKINKDQGIENRHRRLRNVVEQLEEREQQFSSEVVDKFNDLDIQGIEELAKEKHKKQKLKEMLLRFLDYYQNKKW